MTSVFCTVGMSGAGKSEAVRLLASMAEFHLAYFGGVVLQEVRNRGLALTPSNEAVVREDLRLMHGMAVMAEKCLPTIRDAIRRGSNVLVDGLYSYSEYKVLRSEFGNSLVVIAIHATKSIRARRLSERPLRPLTYREMEERDRLEIENLEKAPPICLADFHIVNDAGVRELRNNLADTLLKAAVRDVSR